MRKLLAIFVLAFLAQSASAQSYSGVPEKFFGFIATGKTSEAIDYVYGTNPWLSRNTDQVANLEAELRKLLSGCEATCGNEPIASISSPSGKSKAITFNRNCGATTGFNTQVSIIKASDSLPNEGGNLLILEGTVPLTIHWVTENQVFIAGVGAAKAFKQEKSVSGVAAAYE